MKNKVPFRNIFSNDTTNIGSCTSPYHERFGPAGREQVWATVKEVEGLADAHFIQLAHGQVPWYKSKIYSQEEHARWWSEYFGVPHSDFEKLSDLQKYMHEGGDILGDFIEACRKLGQAPFVSLRVNDAHHVEWIERRGHLHGFHSISKFIAENRDKMLGTDLTKWKERALNWIYPEIPAHMLDIVREQCEDYDIDGYELDFMRHPFLFKLDETTFDQRSAIVGGFITEVRKILDKIGRNGKHRYLCVRVPAKLSMWSEIGLSPEMLEGLGVEMVNISSHFYCNQWIDMKDFVRRMPNLAVYFEVCHCTYMGKKLTKSDYDNFTFRRTTKNEYYSTAKLAYEAGAAGISFFNFVYYREHGAPPEARGPFNEPPFEVVGKVRDRDFIDKTPEHFFIARGWREAGTQLDKPLKTNESNTLTLYLTDIDRNDNDYRVRIVSNSSLEGITASLSVGGTRADVTYDISEPYSEDNDYPPLHGTSDNSRAFIISGALLKGGLNELTLLFESENTDTIMIEYLDIFPARYSTK